METAWCMLQLVALWGTANTPAAKLNLNSQAIIIDLRRSPVGSTGNVHTGCIGVSVRITERTQDTCIFDYYTDGCGGITARYQCKLPITMGLVVIEARNGGIIKSFSNDRLNLLSRSGPPSK